MEHGGDIYSEGLLKGKSLLDFSSNINPLGVPESFKNSVLEALSNSIYYPDIKYRKLKESIKEYMAFSLEFFEGEEEEKKLENENILLGNGASEIIDLVFSEFKKVLLVVPSFIDYENCARKWGAEIEYSFLNKDMEYNYEDIKEKLKDREALIIGNPNNPNGVMINKESFKEILDYCEKEGKTIIIDEAFVEFAGKGRLSFYREALEYNCVFIIRALTKFFALPGVRLGWGITKDRELSENIRKKQNPWNINCFAEIAAVSVLKDKEYIEKSLKWIEEERKFLLKELLNINFIEKIYKTHGNYILCKLKNINCDELYEKCLKNDILIRKADNYRGLDKGYVRFAIKNRESNLKLIKVLRKL